MKQLLATIGGIVIVSVLVLVLLVAAKSFNDNEQTQTITTSTQKALATHEAKVAINQATTATAQATVGTAQAITGTAQAKTAIAQAKTATVLTGTITAQSGTATATVKAKRGEYTFISQSDSVQVKAGGIFHITFTLQNIGNNNWSQQDGYQLQCIDSDPSAIPCDSSDVKWCSDTVTLEMVCAFIVTMKAPMQTGRYKAFWQLQHNNQSIAPQGSPYMFVAVTVS